MKELFIITYIVISTHPRPCPDRRPDSFISCAVDHGMVTKKDTVEVITTDTARVNTLLREHPAAKVDTFLLTPAK